MANYLPEACVIFEYLRGAIVSYSIDSILLVLFLFYVLCMWDLLRIYLGTTSEFYLGTTCERILSGNDMIMSFPDEIMSFPDKIMSFPDKVPR